MCTRTRVCIYTCDKELSENSPRIDRNGANFNDNVRGNRDTLDRCEKRNKTQICAKWVFKQLFRVRIKNFNSRRSIFPFGLFYVFLWSGFLICFCVVCSVFVWKCIALSCECILLSVFNRDFITPFTSLCRVFIRF